MPDGFEDVCALHTSVVNSVKQTKALTAKNCREMILLIKYLSNVTEDKTRCFYLIGTKISRQYHIHGFFIIEIHHMILTYRKKEKAREIKSERKEEILKSG